MAPWTADEFRRKHNHSLSDKQARHAAAVANRVLRESGDEGKAIRIANASVKGKGRRGK